MRVKMCKIFLYIIVITLFLFVIYLVSQNKTSEELLTNNAQPAYEKKEYSVAYLNVLFDKLDSAVNKGDGYSRYLNTDGFPTGALLAWSESYLLQAYVNMYRAVGETKYLSKLNSHIKSVISNRDDKIGQKDHKGRLIPAWGATKYAKNNEWTHYVVHTGMIAYPILDFIQLVKETNAHEYLDDANVFLMAIEESVNYHNKNWKTNHYVYPEGLNKEDHILAINQQAAMGRCLILLYRITGKEEYLKKATLLAEFIKEKSVRTVGSGRYVLTDVFRAGKNVSTSKIADISHAVITIHFAYLAYKNGIVFDETDMHRFAKTIKKLAVDNNNRFPFYLDGKGSFDCEIVAGEYAFLAEFDGDIADSIADLLFEKLRIDLTAKYMQEDRWGQVMLGLSRLALYQKSSAKLSRSTQRRQRLKTDVILAAKEILVLSTDSELADEMRDYVFNPILFFYSRKDCNVGLAA